MVKAMLDNACFQMFHTDTGNPLRNNTYNKAIKNLSFMPKLNSETFYLDTFDKVKEFHASHPKFKMQTIEGYDANGKTFPSNSGISGIWASTYMAYKEFVKSDKEVLLIFEDDISVSPNFKQIAETYMSELPADWEVFSFFVPNDSLFAYNSGAHDIPNGNFICKSYQQWAMCGYAISKKAAKKVIKDVETRGIEAPIDWYLFNFRMKPEFLNITFNTYTVKPGVYKPIELVTEVSSISTVLTMDMID